MITCARFYQQSREVGLETRFLLTLTRGFKGQCRAVPILAFAVAHPHFALIAQLVERHSVFLVVGVSGSSPLRGTMLVAL